jgi:D-alanyl-D-alanine carboxypeptidase (penicillin-binding protein 5/6)
MNNKAAEIGALNTKFKNPDGYHIDGHYSNAYDLALIAGFAMKNEYFRNLVSIEQYESEYSNSIWENRNLLLDQNSEYFYEYATGIKTGHTGEAGYTLASSATNNNINLIAITLLGDEDKIRWEDTIKLFDYGFTNFTLHEFNYVNKVVDNVKTSKRYSPFKDSLEVITLENAQKVISKDESEKIETKIQYNDDIVKTNNEEIVLKSPIKKGQILGEISYSIDGKIISSSQLIASSDSGLLNKFEEKLYMFDDWVKSNFVIFSFSMVIVMYFLYFIIKKWKSKRRRKRRLF